MSWRSWGFPVARLEISVDRPQALVAARLCDVWPDGASRLITRGFLNLTHRSGHEELEELVPGKRYTVELKLNSIACGVPAGHRTASPSRRRTGRGPAVPERVQLSVYSGDRSELVLPVLTRGFPSHEPPAHFFEPEEAPTPEHAVLRSEDTRRDILSMWAAGGWRTTNGTTRERFALPTTASSTATTGRWTSSGSSTGTRSPPSTAVSGDIVVGRGNWQTRVHTLSTMTSTADAFQLSNVLEAYEGEARVYVLASTVSVPRDHV